MAELFRSGSPPGGWPMCGTKTLRITSCHRSIRVSKKFANVGSSRCLVYLKKLQQVLYPEQQLPISQVCVPVATNYFVDAAGTLPARVFTVRRKFASSPAPMRTQRFTNRF